MTHILGVAPIPLQENAFNFLIASNNSVTSFLCFNDFVLDAHLKICFRLIFFFLFFKFFAEVFCMGGTEHLWVIPS